MKHPLTRTGKELLDADGKHIADCDTEEIAEMILRFQAQLAERDAMLEEMVESLKEGIENAESVILEGSKHFCTEDERLFIIDAKQALANHKRGYG